MSVSVKCPCGFSGTYRTQGLADRSLRVHSCERHRRLTAAARRGRARAAAIDRTPRPCEHKRTTHQHGTHACYVLDRCRCIPCATANSAYETERIRNIAYGRTTTTDATPVREHLQALLDAGMGLKQITRVHGISSGSLTKILYGITRADGTHRPAAKKVLRTTADRVLAIPLPTIDELAGGQRTDSTGAARRIQALAALGWSIAQVAEHAGLNRQALDAALAGGPILVRNARAIRDAYDALASTRPTPTTTAEKVAVSRTLHRAAAEQWAPPAAWDDEQLDDPTAPRPIGYGRPGECATPGCAQPPGQGMRLCWPHYAAQRRGSYAPPNVKRVDLDEWAHLVRGGVDPSTAATRCGVQAKNPIGTIEKLAYRDERDDILRLIQQTRAAA